MILGYQKFARVNVNHNILRLSLAFRESSSICYLPIRFKWLQQWTIFGTLPFDFFRFTQSEGEPLDEQEMSRLWGVSIQQIYLWRHRALESLRNNPEIIRLSSSLRE